MTFTKTPDTRSTLATLLAVVPATVGVMASTFAMLGFVV